MTRGAEAMEKERRKKQTDSDMDPTVIGQQW